jgi:glycosyltransferase involved in cell wall biosynthesis
VLLVSAMFPPIKTGTSFYARNLACALQARGHEVTLVALESDEPHTENLPFPVHRLPAVRVRGIRFFKHFRVSTAHLANFRRIRELATAARAQAVLLVNHYLDIAFLAIYAARRLRIPLLCSVGTQLQSSDPWRHRLLNVFDRLICGRLIFPHCERIIAWDKEILRYLTDVHGAGIARKCAIVNFGVNGELSGFLAHRHDYRLQNQIVCIGSVIKQRSYVSMIRAFQELAGEFPALRLKIIGHVYFDAALRAVQQAGLSQRVTFTGELAHDEVLRELAASDAYYVSLTGRYLGLGTATMEAMLMGVPAIANVPADLLGTVRMDDGHHLLIADSDPGAIASKIRSLLRDREQRERVGQGGRQFIQANMSWERVAADMEAAIMPLVR